MKVKHSIQILFIIVLTSSVLMQSVLAKPQRTIVDLTPDGAYSAAYSINERGDIVGYSYDTSWVKHAVLWTTTH